jgi:hypothetical protein
VIGSRGGPDEGVSEVVSYALMFALGAVALTVSMDMFVDAQERGATIAAAQEASSLAEVTGTTTSDAATVAHATANATFATTVELPQRLQGTNFTISYRVPCEPDPSDTNEWEDFWDVNNGPWSSPTGCPTNTDCPVNPEVHVSTSDEDLDATTRLGNRTVGQVTKDRCLVLDTQAEVSASARSFDVSFEDDGGWPTITLDANNR